MLNVCASEAMCTTRWQRGKGQRAARVPSQRRCCCGYNTPAQNQFERASPRNRRRNRNFRREATESLCGTPLMADTIQGEFHQDCMAFTNTVRVEFHPWMNLNAPGFDKAARNVRGITMYVFANVRIHLRWRAVIGAKHTGDSRCEQRTWDPSSSRPCIAPPRRLCMKLHSGQTTLLAIGNEIRFQYLEGDCKTDEFAKLLTESGILHHSLNFGLILRILKILHGIHHD